MDHLRTLLPQVLRKRGLYHEAEAALIVHHAMQWLHGALPGCSTTLKVRSFLDRTLTVEAANAVAAQEAQLASVDLLKYLREECGHIHIDTIRLSREA